MTSHPDLSPVFTTNASLSCIWKSYANCRTDSFNLKLNFKKILNLKFCSSYLRTKQEKTLKYFKDCFLFADAYVDFQQQGLLVGQGIVFDYLDYCVDVVVIRKRSISIKLNNKLYHRNTNLKVYITSEFITKHKKAFDIVYATVNKLKQDETKLLASLLVEHLKNAIRKGSNLLPNHRKR
jgi:hypothetical protein